MRAPSTVRARPPGSGDARHPDWLWPLLALLGAVAFSGKAIIVKLAYRHAVDAVTLIMLRMLVALPLFVLMAWWAGRGRPALTRRELAAVSALGFAGYYLSSTLDFWGLQYISASLERLILYLTPAVVLLLSWLIFRRRATARQLWALLLGYAGIVMVFGHELGQEGPQVALGAALVLASTLSYALYLIYSGVWVQRMGAARLTGWASAVACLLCLAQFGLLRPLHSVLDLPATVWWLSLLNGTVCTVAPVLMVMVAIQHIGPSRTAQLGMVGPISTIVLGVLLLGEPFTPWLAAGTLCVLASVMLLARTPR
jgi:drug/metabolite transporter (DMT)-like permease